jgi:hypothetical protein
MRLFPYQRPRYAGSGHTQEPSEEPEEHGEFGHGFLEFCYFSGDEEYDDWPRRHVYAITLLESNTPIRVG